MNSHSWSQAMTRDTFISGVEQALKDGASLKDAMGGKKVEAKKATAKTTAPKAAPDYSTETWDWYDQCDRLAERLGCGVKLVPHKGGRDEHWGLLAADGQLFWWNGDAIAPVSAEQRCEWMG